MKNHHSKTDVSRVAFFGASPDTGNQGVNALHDAVLAALCKRGIRATDVFGFTPEDTYTLDNLAGNMSVERHAAYRTRRIYRGESLFALRIATRLGISRHHGARALNRANAIVDISAGDSFTDIYGWHRFYSVMAPKQIAVENSIPLILLPQTIGPFETRRAERSARSVLQKATQVWTRDENSQAAALQVLGDHPAVENVRCGVDMAFLLEPRKPAKLPNRLAKWLQEDRREAESPLTGFNVSGLIYNRAAVAQRQFNLQTDYRETVRKFLAWILSESDAKLLLVPHVLTPVGSPESDFAAATEIADMLRKRWSDRVEILPPEYSAAELKWIIGQTAWFCGTRMHSTIAALGSGVPAASLAYSMKTRGVFASCGLEDSVFELSQLDTADALAALKASWVQRDEDRHRLSQHLPWVMRRAEGQADSIVESIIGNPQSVLPRKSMSFDPGRQRDLSISDLSPTAATTCVLNGKGRD